MKGFIINMILTLISPDKLTLSMFTDFYRTVYSEGRIPFFIPVNSSLSQYSKEKIIEGVKINYNPDKDLIFFTIKTPFEAVSKKDPDLKQHYMKYLLKDLEEISSYIVAFDIYSITPIMIKDQYGNLTEIIQRWESNLKKLGDS